jgi:hypothetical protein
MSGEAPRSSWSLPFDSPVPQEPKARRRVRLLRVAACVALAGAAVTPVVQFQVGTMKRLRRGEAFDRKHPNWCPATATVHRPGAHKGAIGRWRKAAQQFWRGRNIYQLIPEEHWKLATQPVSSVDCPADYGPVWMHPNCPFTVILLSPFAYLPVWAMALSYNAAKLLALAAAVLMAARLAGHRRRRVVDWVVLLGVLWTLPLVIADVRHGNTNVFVLAGIVLHLWLYRRGRDWLAGLPLAAAICLKMTPALFLLYWLYQRNWRLLGATLAALLAFGVVIPAAAVGPRRCATLTETWYRNMIRPGLLKGSWYPEHINQSLSGVVSRYFLAGRNGDIFWGPDDDPHYRTRQHGWITLVSLPEGAVRWALRVCQAAIVALTAWAIGWRKLPRDDGRRALHYGLVLLGMMLLNQRTWNHHAAVLLPGGVAIWQAVAFGRFSQRRRALTLGLALVAGACVWLARGELFSALARLAGQTEAQSKMFADVAKAFGPTFFYFALLFAAAIVLAAALRRTGDPYAEQRQKLLDACG